MARNESVFLPIWVQYYGRFFSAENIIILDHGSDDGSVERLNEAGLAQRIAVDHPIFNDFPWYTNTIIGTQQKLLELYELVVFAEPDEILWHPSGLGNYLVAFRRDGICATGYDVHHRVDCEPPIDLTRPILSQRRFWHRNTGFDKPLIGRVPIDWNCPGFHASSNITERDPELKLLHLHKMDFGTALRKNERNRKYQWDKISLEGNRGRQSLLLDKEFEVWFNDGSRYGNEIEEIPPFLRNNPPI